jgi:hypothetical protein
MGIVSVVKKLSTILLAFAMIACVDMSATEVEQSDFPTLAPAADPNDDPPNMPIKRLLPYELSAIDGTTAIVPGVWYDTLLGITCTFVSDEGGDASHCIPEATSVPSNYFGDPSCSQPIAIMEKCPFPPRFIREVDPTACVTTIGLRPLGKPLASSSNWYLSGNNCIQQPALLSHFVAYPILDVMPWSDFVSAVRYPIP